MAQYFLELHNVKSEDKPTLAGCSPYTCLENTIKVEYISPIKLEHILEDPGAVSWGGRK